MNQEKLHISRRNLIAGVAGLGAVSLLSACGSERSSADQTPVTPEAEVEAEMTFNGLTQDPNLYDGRLNPRMLLDKTESGSYEVKSDAELKEMMTIYIGEDTATDMDLATTFVRNWELATNAGCEPISAQSALDAGYSLERVEGRKSVDKNYSEFTKEKFGVLFDYLTNDTYEGHDISDVVENIEGYAETTSHNFGNHISAAPDIYGASADVTTRITVDSVKEADTFLTADRQLDVGVTMEFNNPPYRASILKGNIHLLFNEDGDKYDATMSDINTYVVE